MKAEFELTIDASGDPIIIIKNHDKSSDLEQLLLKVFIERSLNKGIYLTRVGGFSDPSNGISYNNYHININP